MGSPALAVMVLTSSMFWISLDFIHGGGVWVTQTFTSSQRTSSPWLTSCFLCELWDFWCEWCNIRAKLLSVRANEQWPLRNFGSSFADRRRKILHLADGAMALEQERSRTHKRRMRLQQARRNTLQVVRARAFAISYWRKIGKYFARVGGEENAPWECRETLHFNLETY